MNYLKYYQDQGEYIKAKNDCWTFVQKIFKEEQNIDLPDIPIFEDEDSFVRSNVKHVEVDKAEEGVAVHVKAHFIEHIGYALNENQYIHKTINHGVQISKIPHNARFYKVLND